MTLPNAILFPQALLPLYIFEPRYRQMLADALQSHRMFSVAKSKAGSDRETPSTIAGLGLIRASVLNPDGTSNLLLQGIVRVKLAETVQDQPYRVQRISPLQAEPADSVMVDALTAKVRDLIKERLSQGFQLTMPLVRQLSKAQDPDELRTLTHCTLKYFIKYLDQLEDPDQISDLVSCTLLSSTEERQTLLETVEVESRLKHLIHFLMAEIQSNRKDDGHE